jgi:hypothetical protein
LILSHKSERGVLQKPDIKKKTSKQRKAIRKKAMQHIPLEFGKPRTKLRGRLRKGASFCTPLYIKERAQKTRTGRPGYSHCQKPGSALPTANGQEKTQLLIPNDVWICYWLLLEQVAYTLEIAQGIMLFSILVYVDLMIRATKRPKLKLMLMPRIHQ